MRKISYGLFTLILCTSCVYDNNCPDQEQGDVFGSSDTASDTGIDETLVENEFFLSPDIAMAGEVVILSMRSDTSVDFSAISEVSFLEDIDVCTMSARDDELLMSITIDDDVVPGAIDLIVEMQDGSHTFLEAAFTVLDPNADEQPQDGGGSGEEDPDNSGGGGSGSQGSGCG